MSEFPCQICGSLKNFHKKGCELRKPDEPWEFMRERPDLPKVGEWFVLKFYTPMGFNLDKGRKTYAMELTMARVLRIKTHGRDYLVEFDMESCKDFAVNFDGDLFTRADRVAKALRDMANMVEQGTR